jgi:hypothetical protein
MYKIGQNMLHNKELYSYIINSIKHNSCVDGTSHIH